MVGELLRASQPGPEVEAVRARLGDRYTVHDVLPWGQTLAYFRADSPDGPVIVAALPIDCQDDPETEAAFVCAAFDLEGIVGRGVPSIVEHGVADGMPFVIYTAPPGVLLAERLERGPLSARKLLGVGEAILEALSIIHRHGMVHGELCPENIVIDERVEGDELPKVSLLGAGIVPLVLDARDATRTSLLSGSPYQAPELLGGGAPTASSDLYALGALLHHMVSGEPPEGFETLGAYGDCPTLFDVVRRSMSRTPSRRYESAHAMRAALDWVEVESEKMNAHTLDIPLWMEHSMVGNIPVPDLLRAGGSIPPGGSRSSHPPASPATMPPRLPPMPAPSRMRGEATSPGAPVDLSDPSIRIEYDIDPESGANRGPVPMRSAEAPLGLPMWAQGVLAVAVVVAAGVVAWLMTG